jgi:hypothetical protein
MHWHLPSSTVRILSSLFFSVIQYSVSDPVFVDVYGAQELIPSNRFHQSMSLGVPVRQIGLP